MDYVKAVADFFREKNHAWLTDSNDVLLHYVAGSPADCASYREVRAKRQSLLHREGVRYRKAKTNLQILSAQYDPEREVATVRALEQVRLFYDQQSMLDYESRVNHHRLLLLPFGNSWRVLEDEVVCERSVPYVRAEDTDDSGELDETGEPDVTDEEWAETERSLPELRGRYDRVRAYKYAELWWNGYNPAYQQMKGNDCTNYTSQVLHAGGVPMIGGRSRNNGWWYRAKGKSHNWSYSWAVAHSFKLALPRYLKAQQVADPRQLKIGDILCYDWNGDGRWQHNTVVVDFDRYGMPLVNAHTVASHRRYWDYRDSYAFTPRTQYLFYRIPDLF